MTRADRASSDEHVREQTADEAVEDDGLRQREAEPLDSLQLTAKLGLARDGLDHRAEDVPDADPGTERAEADAERERDRLPGVGAVRGGCEVEERGQHVGFPPSGCHRGYGGVWARENRAGQGRRERFICGAYGRDRGRRPATVCSRTGSGVPAVATT